MTTIVRGSVLEQVSVKDFGAVGDGVTDDTAAIQAAIDANPGKTIYFPGTFGTSGEINVTDAGTKLQGLNWSTPAIYKLPGFSGAYALKIGDGINGRAYCELEDFYIEGNNEAGDGLVLAKLGSFTGTNIRSYNNQGWGIHRDGLWLSAMNNVNVLNNGVDGVGGGGILDTFIIRETSDLTCTNVNSNSNQNHQILWDEAQSATNRMVAYNQYGGAYETINSAPNSPVGEFKCGDRSVFFGVRFNTAVNNPSNAISVGSSAGVSNVKDLMFIACHTQQSNAAGNITAVQVTGEIESLFFDRHDHRGSEKFLDADGMTAGNVWIDNSPTIGSSFVIDSNKRVLGSNMESGILGRRFGSAGNEMQLVCYEEGVEVWLLATATGGEQRGLKIIANADEDQVLFNKTNPKLQAYSTEPPGGSNGLFAYCSATTDVGNGFGASGAGFYGWVAGSWQKF